MSENDNDVGPGSWHFDYDHDTISFADDPTGHVVEISVTRTAFSPTAVNVTIRGLVIEKYAIPPQMGAVGDQYPAEGWVVENNEVRLNHGAGINLTTNSVARGNVVHTNGQMGIGASGDDVLIENNEISFNNFAHINAGWEAGASKFANTTNLIVRDNCVHHNYGRGLWTDIRNYDVLYEGNIVFSNVNEGIFHEISFDGIIRDNMVGLNGEETAWLYGANILISSSGAVEVTGNRVEVAADFGNGIAVIWQDRGEDFASLGNDVHDNEVAYLGDGGQSGAAADFDPAYGMIFEQNAFDGNTYHMLDLNGDHFAWDNGTISFEEFQSLGQETNGAADTLVSAHRWSCSMTW